MAEIRVGRTNAGDPQFLALIAELDALLAELNGERHGFYAGHNQIDPEARAVVAYVDGVPRGCGAFRPLAEGVEIKRMYVQSDCRGQGVGRAILEALETWAAEDGHAVTRLETSRRLTAANRLYLAAGYRLIPNYGPYVGVEDSVCMEKAAPGTK